MRAINKGVADWRLLYLFKISCCTLLRMTEAKRVVLTVLGQSVKLIFTRGHISLEVAFKGPNVILGLYKCNYSLTVKQELRCRWVETRCWLKLGGGPDSAPRALCLPPVS